MMVTKKQSQSKAETYIAITRVGAAKIIAHPPFKKDKKDLIVMKKYIL